MEEIAACAGLANSVMSGQEIRTYCIAIDSSAQEFEHFFVRI